MLNPRKEVILLPVIPFFDTTPGSVPEEQMMSAGSTAGDDDMPGADDLNIGSADLIIHDLAIVPHASHLFEHGHDGDGAVDPDTVPLSISVLQTILTSRVTGMLHSAPTHLSCHRKGMYSCIFCMLCFDLP